MHGPEPPAARVNNRSLSGVCVMRKSYLWVCVSKWGSRPLCHCRLYQCLSPFLRRLAPPVVTGGSVPLRLSARRRTAGWGLQSNGSLPEGEARWPARGRFDLCGRDFTGMEDKLRRVFFTTDQHGVQLIIYQQISDAERDYGLSSDLFVLSFLRCDWLFSVF